MVTATPPVVRAKQIPMIDVDSSGALRRAPRCFAVVFAVAHTILVAVAAFFIFQPDEGMEIWTRSLVLYLVDLPLSPLYIVIENNQHIENDTVFVVIASTVFGGLLYGGLGWLAGFLWLRLSRRTTQIIR